jgi:hypothetical protein
VRARSGAVAAAVLVMAATLALGPAPVDSSLREPPVAFTLSPRLVAPDQPLTLRVVAAPAARWAHESPLDVYIMWATTERAAFLGPDGVWSPVPVAFRPSMNAASAPMVLEWRPPEPHGEIPLAMVAVPAGVDPLLRSNWTYRPVLRSARVAVEAPHRPLDSFTAAAVLSATALAILLVALVPWGPAAAAQEPRSTALDSPPVTRRSASG